jgi:hypothetical protein
MPSNAFAAAFEHNDLPRHNTRLPARTAALSVFVLSLVSWAAVLVPVLALIYG